MGNKQVKERPWKRQVLVAKEKHSTRVFDATTREALYASALTLLKERMDSGYYYEEPEAPAEPAMTIKQLEALPEGAIKRAGLREWEDRDEALQEYRREHASWLRMTKALEEKDGSLAWEALRARYDYEYEYVDLVELE